MTRTNYIDKAAFTDLFADPAANHDAICIVLFKLVSTLAELPSLKPDRFDAIEDAKQHATMHCIKRIRSFRYRPGANAFSFFTSVAMNALRTFRERERRHRFCELWPDNDERGGTRN